jgi:diadenosine tetraphosphate (Ap4A) HIT family hydrolase
MKCEYCELLEGNGKGRLIYEDSDLAVAVRDLAVTPGQLTVFPKKHFTIMEMVPDEVLRKCSVMANKVSIAAFEALGSKGTNILIENGLGAGQKRPHFGIEIIPRQEEDGLNLGWAGREQLSEEEMERVSGLVKEMLSRKEEPVLEERKEVSDAEKKEEKKEGKKDGKNYLLKSARRMP